PKAPRMASVAHGSCTPLCTLSGYVYWRQNRGSQTLLDGWLSFSSPSDGHSTPVSFSQLDCFQTQGHRSV
ncbi:hypothetical protein B0H65DRAFT_437427, partial [Neurospora tetraspora]